MFLVGILSWWYGEGWRGRMRIITERLARTTDFFSIGLLAVTLFSPFRQISAGKVQGSLDVQLRAFADQLISRLIGAIVRFGTILFGLGFIVLQLIFASIVLLGWLVIPILPIAGLIMTVIGWVPQ